MSFDTRFIPTNASYPTVQSILATIDINYADSVVVYDGQPTADIKNNLLFGNRLVLPIMGQYLQD